MDFEAELAAFAEVERLAEQADASTAAAAATPAASGPLAAPASAAPSSATAAASSSAVANGAPQPAASAAAKQQGVKRKSTNLVEGGAATKKSHAVVMVAAAAVASASPPVAAIPDECAFSDLVAADRAALMASRAAAAHSAAGESSYAAASNGGGEQYVPGQVYGGWLASVDANGQPCWEAATPEAISASALRLQQAADAASVASAALKKQTKAAKEAAAAAAAAATGQQAQAQPGEKHHLRTAAGRIWDDPTLEDWPENDFRIFCGDLGNDVTDALLTGVFDRWPSFVRARVVRDKRTGKTKGFGFASFMSAEECVAALKEVDGKYVGNRPIKLRKSDWTKREASKEKSWTAKHNQFGNTGNQGNKKLHLY